MDTSIDDIVRFWVEAGPQKWFAKDDAFDAEIATRFRAAHEHAACNAYAAWRQTPQGALALLLLLDQFPRNLFRNSAHAFATDAMALRVAKDAVEQGFDRQVDEALQAFFYLPYMHCEALDDQRACVMLCNRPGLENNRQFALLHLDIIERFGRFPHRNGVLGRVTTAQEQAFLDGGGFAG